MTPEFPDKRPEVISLVRKEIYGPSDINSEEILSDNPLTRYFCGVLYPQRAKAPIEEGDDGTPDSVATSVDDGPVEPTTAPGEVLFNDLTEDEEECLNLSNAYKQSALSLSIALKMKEHLKVKVTFARYDKNESSYSWKRKPMEKEFEFGPADYPGIMRKTETRPLFADQTGKLSLNIFYRWKDGDTYVFTFSVVNETKAKDGDGRHVDSSNCFFQVQLTLECEEGLSPMPKRELFKNPSEDNESNALLYRQSKKYAIGHGCSPVWNDRDEIVRMVQSEFLPQYELKTIVPLNSSLSMEDMYKDEDGGLTFTALHRIAGEYKTWIDAQEKKTLESGFEEKYKEAARHNLSHCRECLARIEEGVRVLENDNLAFQAFRLMNEAMLLQQIHSKVDKRPIIKKPDKTYGPSEGVIPVLEDKSTWKQGEKFGYWRLFQIAFILISIPGIVDRDNPEHSFVDLIWFPTGGGKTEAYLGLSAFVILYKRLLQKDDGDCVQIFMRYTLRLLTSQQYERAAALVCALEYLRRRDSKALGEKPITIGLWVGSATTPNTMSDAIKTYDALNSGHGGKYPFAITKCPWCGSEIGPSQRRIFGIKKKDVMVGRSRKRVLYFNCPDPNCEFHSDNDMEKGLPLHVVDEQIYQNPPTFLIGTVDKFAILPYKPAAKNLFGLREGPKKGRNHPELIIQDELHLISGPLGSTVAAYEIMIDFFCSYEEDGAMVRPKIIASTATISQAKRQCHELFDVAQSQVKIFPPSCIDNGETFFSKISMDSPGREYVGIYAPGAQSTSTAAIHILAALFEGKRFIDYGGNEDLKDVYWTNVCYYNAIRELAQAVNWVDADIYEHARVILHRNPDHEHVLNWLPRPTYLEMNSRNQDIDIGTGFDALSQKVGEESAKERALDFCFATNMISVGIDIPRLGLMTVWGQPKTTSEYIQATSRVGRSTKRPGLIFTFYYPGKPRDKSIFESFEDFHSKFYSYVEPTSISPFCSELRSRVIPALVVGMTRYMASDDSSGGFGFKKAYADGFADVAENTIMDRVRDIDPAEETDTKTQIDSLLDTWGKRQNIDLYNYPLTLGMDLSKKANDSIPAICPDSEYPFIPDGWRGGTKAAPTSMRSVDLGCKLEINDNYNGGQSNGEN